MIAESWRRLRTAADATRAILTARYLLWRGGLPAAMRHYGLVADDGGGPAPASSSRPDVAGLPVLGAAVRVLRAPVVGSSCLPTSLAVMDLLGRRGVGSDLVIGIASRSGNFESHAWVEAASRRLDLSRIPPASYQEIGRFRVPGQGAP